MRFTDTKRISMHLVIIISSNKNFAMCTTLNNYIELMGVSPTRGGGFHRIPSEALEYIVGVFKYRKTLPVTSSDYFVQFF